MIEYKLTKREKEREINCNENITPPRFRGGEIIERKTFNMNIALAVNGLSVCTTVVSGYTLSTF